MADPISKSYLETLARIESGNNPKAKAKTSSAAGLYQFTEGTWTDLVNQMGLDYSLDDRFDPEKAGVVIKQFTEDNKNFLSSRLNRDISDSELYLAHFLGRSGALRLLQSTDAGSNDAIDDIIGEGAINANPGVFINDGMLRTPYDVLNWANDKFGIENTQVAVNPDVQAPIDLIESSPQAQGLDPNQVQQIYDHSRLTELDTFTDPIRALENRPEFTFKDGGNTNCGGPGQPPCKPIEKIERLEALYDPIIGKVMEAYGYKIDYNDPDSVGEAILKFEKDDSIDINPDNKFRIIDTYFPTMNTFEDRNPPPIDEDIIALQNKIVNTSDEEIRELLKKDYSKAGLFNFMKFLPDNVKLGEALGYAKKYKKLQKQGYTYKEGGKVDNDNSYTEINSGGKHEESALGGVPMGPNALVEEGEVKHNGYILSDHLKLSKDQALQFNIPDKYVNKTFAEIARKLDSNRSKNNKVDEKSFNRLLNQLVMANEMGKHTKKKGGLYKKGGMYNDGGQPCGGPGQPPCPELTNQDKQNIKDSTGIGFESSTMDRLFGLNPGETPSEFPQVNLGRYGDVGYFDVIQNNADGIVLGNTGKNPHNISTVNNLIPYLMEQNQGRNVSIDFNYKKGGYYKDGGGLLSLKGANPAQLASVGSSFLSAVTKDDNVDAIAGGAAQGAQLGSIGGPLGMGIGAAAGGLMELLNKQKAKKEDVQLGNEQAILNTTISDFHDGGRPHPHPHTALRPWQRPENHPEAFINGEAINSGQPYSITFNPADGGQPFVNGPSRNTVPEELRTNPVGDMQGAQNDVPFGGGVNLLNNPFLNATNPGTLTGNNDIETGRIRTDLPLMGDSINPRPGTSATSGSSRNPVGRLNLSTQGLAQVGDQAPILNSLPDLTGGSSSNGSASTTGQNEQTPDNDRFNFNNLLRFAPVAGNLARLLTAPDAEVERFNRLDNRFQRDLFDEQSVVRNVREQRNNLNNALANASSGDAGALRANLLASNVNSNRALSEAMFQGDNINRRQNELAQNFNLQVDNTNLQQDNLERRVNAQNRGAAQTYRNQLMDAILGDVGNIGRERTLNDILENTTGYDFLGRKQNKRGGMLSNLYKEMKYGGDAEMKQIIKKRYGY